MRAGTTLGAQGRQEREAVGRVQRLVAALAALAAAVRSEHPEIPEVRLRLANKGPGPSQASFFANTRARPLRVARLQAGQRGVPLELADRVTLSTHWQDRWSGEALGATLVHELVHALAWARRLQAEALGEDTERWKDTVHPDRQTCIHTLVFAELAGELQLETVRHNLLGWTHTGLSERARWIYRAELEELDEAIGGLAPGDLARRLHWLGAA